MPLSDDANDVSWPCNDEKYIVHFPESTKFGRMVAGTVAMHC